MIFRLLGYLLAALYMFCVFPMLSLALLGAREPDPLKKTIYFLSAGYFGVLVLLGWGLSRWAWWAFMGLRVNLWLGALGMATTLLTEGANAYVGPCGAWGLLVPVAMHFILAGIEENPPERVARKEFEATRRQNQRAKNDEHERGPGSYAHFGAWAVGADIPRMRLIYQPEHACALKVAAGVAITVAGGLAIHGLATLPSAAGGAVFELGAAAIAACLAVALHRESQSQGAA